MGLFNKNKNAGQAPQPPGGQSIGVQGAGMVDPAILGGPSTKPLAVDDPLLQPINGVALDQYARIVKGASGQGASDEAAVCAYAETQGVAAADFAAAMAGWNDRMKQSMVVGQQFNKVYMAS